MVSLIDSPWARVIQSQMEHPQFLGLTAWDMIFPTFLFIVGLSIPFSLTKRLTRGDSRREIYLHLIKRALILYFFGMVCEAGRVQDLGGLRYTGVLHRIAVCYLCASIIFMITRLRGQIMWFVSLIIAYWLVMISVPVPGFGAGVFTPEGNLEGYIDRLFLPGVIYKGVYDNEGILSTFPAVATTLLGVLIGHWLRTSYSQRRKVAGLFCFGAAGIGLGLLWNLHFPINKLMWTSSFVLFAGGVGIVLLAVFYWLIDVRGYTAWAFPFVIIGLNALTIYVAGNFFDFRRVVIVFTYEFIDSFGIYNPLVMVAGVFMVKWLFLYYLYRRKIFLKA
jgi:predicted acyltransferase